MKSTAKINTEVLKSYIESSNIPLDTIRKSVESIDVILEGSKDPTFKQLVKISKSIRVPIGLLFLDEIIESRDLQVKFRTLESQPVQEFTHELRDTIQEMKEKQEFLRNEIDDECPFIGKLNFKDSPDKILNESLKYLGKNIQKNRLKIYRENLSNAGVFIFFNGKVKDNTHRPLDIEEFRGFALSDKKAPLIFINQKDTKTGQLFTLVHEFIHLMLGNDDLLNNNSNDERKLEAVINNITGKILVPTHVLRKQYNKHDILDTNLTLLSNNCEVSKFVVARRLLDLGYITKKEYSLKISELEAEYKAIQAKKSTSSGGNYRNNLLFRIDNKFFRYVDGAVKQNKISYTEAIDIVGVKYNGYKILSERG